MEYSGCGTYRLWNIQEMEQKRYGTYRIWNIQDVEHTVHMVVLDGLVNVCCSVCYKQTSMLSITLNAGCSVCYKQSSMLSITLNAYCSVCYKQSSMLSITIKCMLLSLLQTEQHAIHNIKMTPKKNCSSIPDKSKKLPSSLNLPKMVWSQLTLYFVAGGPTCRGPNWAETQS